MKDRRRALLNQLLEETGFPPPDDAPAEEMLEKARAMVERRAVIVEALNALGPVEDRSEIEREWVALREREDLWAKHILRARDEISRRLDAIRSLPHPHRSPVRKSIGTRRRA